MVVLPTVLAMAGPVLVRRRLNLDQLRLNNEVAGFKFATVGVLYAVLLAFAVIVVWQRFSDAEKAVAQEAGAATTIYRLARGIDAGPRMAVRDRLNGYLESAVAKEWTAMERGRVSPEVTRALDEIYSARLTFSAHDSNRAVLRAEILHQLDLITQARRERLVLASGTVPGVLWVVLFGGAVLTIGFTLFFGAENVRAQMMMTGALSLLICSVLLVTITIDHPFAGPVRVLPKPLSGVLAADRFNGFWKD